MAFTGDRFTTCQCLWVECYRTRAQEQPFMHVQRSFTAPWIAFTFMFIRALLSLLFFCSGRVSNKTAPNKETSVCRISLLRKKYKINHVLLLRKEMNYDVLLPRRSDKRQQRVWTFSKLTLSEDCFFINTRGLGKTKTKCTTFCPRLG